MIKKYKSLKLKKKYLYGDVDDIQRNISEMLKCCEFVAHLTDLYEEVITQPFKEYGLITISFDDIPTMDDSVIVICSYSEFRKYKLKLDILGYLEYENYVSGKLLIPMYSEKELAVFMGTPVLGQVVESLFCINHRCIPAPAAPPGYD